jgi:RNA polymerase sigma-70 factor (ECF subfamily)
MRTALLLREIDGLGYAEIAAQLGIPIGTVRSRIFRAREAVAVELRGVRQDATNRRF